MQVIARQANYIATNHSKPNDVMCIELNGKIYSNKYSAKLNEMKTRIDEGKAEIIK